MLFLLKILIVNFLMITFIERKGDSANFEKIKSSFFKDKTENLPLEIDADQGIICEKEKNMCTAIGNVFVHYGHYQLQCDLLKTYFRLKSNNEVELEKIIAEGHLILSSSQDRYKAFAQYGIYDFLKEEVILKGENLKIEAEDLTMTAHDHFLFSRQQNYAVAVGQACAIRQDKLIQADILKTYFENTDSEYSQNNDQFSRLEATGNVIVSTPNEIAQADHGDYFRNKDLVILLGHVKLTNKNGQIEGDRAEIEIEKGNARVFQNSVVQKSKNRSQRVRVLILPSSKK